MPLDLLSFVCSCLQWASPLRNSSIRTPRYLIVGEGEILVPLIFIFRVGIKTEGFRKITSSVLVALREILLARSPLYSPFRSLLSLDSIERNDSPIVSRLVSSAKW